MASRTFNTSPPTRRGRHAFSVIEALMASVVLAIAVVGIAGPLGASSEQE
jgi:Tfp pilus assembly protein PilV